ncbi:MAG TPA: VWA domain-containing protein [Herpetosiphonaceae bacterium]|nr:VWA domain-containing protein [Herpetosiphonaceae bacterium]
MHLSYALNPAALPVGNPTSLDLLLTLRPEDGPEPRAPRRPLNLGLVIDRSGSMAGNSLKQALKAAETLIGHLGPDDVVSLVVYDDKVDTILPPTNVTDKAAIRDLLRKVRAGGTTNLSAGWLKGCEHVLATRTRAPGGSDMIHRVLLLTDGQANAGVTSPDILINSARQKAEEGVVTTTLGFGSHFNEDLLIGMARAAGGNFYFIQAPEDAEEVFRIEVESLAALAGQNLALTIAPLGGAGIGQIHSNYRIETRPDGALVVEVGDVYAGEDKLLALAINVPAQAALGSAPLLSVSYAYQAVADGAILSVASPEPLLVAAPVVTLDEALGALPETATMVQISRIRIAKAKDQAIAEADAGDHAGAAARLRAIVAELRQSGLDEHFEIAEEIAQLDHFAERLERRQFDPASRKEMRDQSYQAQMRGRSDLAQRGTAGGSAASLATATTADGGVELVCAREGGKLRMRVVSDGYDQSLNIQFPRGIREEGIHYVVDSLQLSANGSFYRATGEIRRLIIPGQEYRGGATAQRARSTTAAKISARTAADLEATSSIDDGVIVQCLRDGSKLRVRVVSDGYDPTYNMRFPRDIREEGMLYVVDNVIEGGGSYIACGRIRRFVQ